MPAPPRTWSSGRRDGRAARSRADRRLTAPQPYLPVVVAVGVVSVEGVWTTGLGAVAVLPKNMLNGFRVVGWPKRLKGFKAAGLSPNMMLIMEASPADACVLGAVTLVIDGTPVVGATPGAVESVGVKRLVLGLPTPRGLPVVVEPNEPGPVVA